MHTLFVLYVFIRALLQLIILFSCALISVLRLVTGSHHQMTQGHFFATEYWPIVYQHRNV